MLETEAPGSHFILGAADRGVQGTRVVSGTLAVLLWASAHGLEMKGNWLTWSSGTLGSNLTPLYFPCYGPNASAPLYRRHGHGHASTGHAADCRPLCRSRPSSPPLRHIASGQAGAAAAAAAEFCFF